jgi:Ankyrin repeats (3 copies)/Ankyrin repeats (many copies)
MNNLIILALFLVSLQATYCMQERSLISFSIHNACDTDSYALLYRAIVGVSLETGKGANIHEWHNNGCTFLHYAASYGHLEIVKYLVNNDANIDAKDVHGCTALYCAAFRGNLKVVQFLISNGADSNSRTDNGHTSLHVAAISGNLEIIHYLINNGVDSNAQDFKGETALDCAIQYSPQAIVALLENYKVLEQQIRAEPTQTLLQIVIEKDFVCLVKLLLLSGVILRPEDLAFAKMHGAKAVGRLIKKYLKLSSTNFGTAIATQDQLNLPEELMKRIASYAV